MKKKIILSLLIFISTFLIYKFIYPNPRNWYDHYKYLAQAFLEKRVDVPNLPQFYHDKMEIGGKTYLPFPPLPALVLAPITYLNSNVTQQQISILIGSFNVVLVFWLLLKFTNLKNSLLLSIFFAFGTVSFWTSIVGTTWYFAHTVAVMFFLLSLIAFKKKWLFFSGVFFSLAVLSRYPIFLGIIFYLLELRKDKKGLIKFLTGALLCVPAQFVYNYLRFGNFFQTGYLEVYRNYVGMNYPFTFLKLVRPNFPNFGYMDPRNIPLHLFTFFLMPPIVNLAHLNLNSLIPSPYGMGIIFTTPLLLFALKPPFKSILERNLFLGALGISLIDFLHYAQGWVQFGYRFLLDFLPFLMIILALRFKPKKLLIFLLVISIIVNTWGVLWGIKLGW